MQYRLSMYLLRKVSSIFVNGFIVLTRGKESLMVCVCVSLLVYLSTFKLIVKTLKTRDCTDSCICARTIRKHIQNDQLATKTYRERVSVARRAYPTPQSIQAAAPHS